MLDLDLDIHQIAQASTDAEADEVIAPTPVLVVHPGPADMRALAEVRRKLGLTPVPVVDLASVWQSTRIEANRTVAPQLMDDVNRYIIDRLGEEEISGDFEFRIEGDGSEAFVIYYTTGPDAPDEPEDGDYLITQQEEGYKAEIIQEEGEDNFLLGTRPNYDEILDAIDEDQERKNTEANVWLLQGESLFPIESEDEEDEEDEEDDDLVDLLLLSDPPPGVTEIADILVYYRDDQGVERNQVWPLRSNGTMSVPEATVEGLVEIIKYRSLSGRLNADEKHLLDDFIKTLNLGLNARAMGGTVHLPPRAQAMIHQLQNALSASRHEPPEDDEEYEDEDEDEEDFD